jgi:transposase
LAKLRDYRVAASEAEIAHSLEGNWREDVLFELQQVVDAYDFHQKQIAACDVELQKYLSALPIRCGPGAGEGSTADVPAEQSNKRRPHKLQKNQPTFDLAAELQRTRGVDRTAIEGVDVMTTQVILSELGPDLSASFPSENHFTSWLELAPRRDIRGGKVRELATAI